MKRLDMLTTLYAVVRTPTGKRIVEEVKRQAADPKNRRRAVDVIRRLWTDRQQTIVVDADPPDQ